MFGWQKTRYRHYRKSALETLYKVQYRLIPHIEQQVEDAEVGDESVLLLVYLVIGFENEVGVGCGMFGMDGLSIVL